jgi:hypothetical protein
MTRDLRFRFTGLVFFIIFFGNLLVTQQGIDLWRALLADVTEQVDHTETDEATNPVKDTDIEVLVAVIGAAVVFFTSEGAGFVLSSLWMLCWNLRAGPKVSFSGYSGMWNKLSYDMKDALLARSPSSSDLDAVSASEELRWVIRVQGYLPDVVLSYFWQQGPEELVLWVSRRFTTYFIYMSAITAVAVGLGASLLVIFMSPLEWTHSNCAVLAVSTLLGGAFWFNSRPARKEALQMLELWQCATLVPDARWALWGLRTASAQSRDWDAVPEKAEDPVD